jgi:hypothetical protein
MLVACGLVLLEDENKDMKDENKSIKKYIPK